MQLFVLGRKISQFQAAVSRVKRRKRAGFRDRLADFHYVQFLVRTSSSKLLHVLAAATLCAAVILAPLALLCAMQRRFLSLHHPWITWSQTGAIVADVAALATFLWRPLTIPRMSPPDRARSARRSVRQLLSVRAFGFVACLCALLICAVAHLPGADERDDWLAWRNLDLRDKILVPNGLEAEIVNALAGDDVAWREQHLAKVSRLGFLQGRDLRYANFFNAVLPRLDLRSRRLYSSDVVIETRLQRANLGWAQMQEVLLDGANLEAATLQGAYLQGGSLRDANLRNADLAWARLQQATLAHATLRRGILNYALLQGADLSRATLRGASLWGAMLQGASLRKADLRGASLGDAHLQGADLTGARLDGADLRRADLRGALLSDADVTGANFEGANVDLTDVSHVRSAAAVAAPPGREPFAGAMGFPRRSRPAAAGNEDDDAHRLRAYLARLACADTYVARGLVAQALYTKDVERVALGEALLDQRSDPACPGMTLLPLGMKALLATQVTPP
jgi:uncharacterized protein YjbI with pentapeptide repeats